MTTSRRTLIRGAAWSVPVVAAALAAPNAAASTIADLGAFSIEGECGVLGIMWPGFRLSASGTAPLPAGTTVTVTGSGIADIGVFGITPGGAASVSVLSGTSRLITLDRALPAGACLQIRTLLSISVAFRLDAVVALPEGYDATGANANGTVDTTLGACTAS